MSVGSCYACRPNEINIVTVNLNLLYLYVQSTTTGVDKITINSYNVRIAKGVNRLVSEEKIAKKKAITVTVISRK